MEEISMPLIVLYNVCKFRIREVRCVNFRVMPVGEIAIRFLPYLAQRNIASYPEFT